MNDEVCTGCPKLDDLYSLYLLEDVPALLDPGDVGAVHNEYEPMHLQNNIKDRIYQRQFIK